MYRRQESDFQRPRSWISLSLRPASRANVATPLRKECPKQWPSIWSVLSALRSPEVTKSRWKDPQYLNNGEDGDAGQSRKRFLNAVTAQASSSLAAAVRVIPRLNGSVFEVGNVKLRRSLYSLTERRVRNQVVKSAYSRSFSEYVNSPIRRNVAKARQKAIYSITPDRDNLSRSGRI